MTDRVATLAQKWVSRYGWDVFYGNPHPAVPRWKFDDGSAIDFGEDAWITALSPGFSTDAVIRLRVRRHARWRAARVMWQKLKARIR